VNAFHVCGALLAVWAVLVSYLGITHENFPGSAERLVGAISVLLVLAAIGSAIYIGATEEEDEGHGAEAALIRRA
jgi:hypothetical protein